MDRKELEEIFSGQRHHASYFNYKRDKETTELGVVCDWIDAYHGPDNDLITEICHVSDGTDPPDVILTTKDHGEYAIEVTELVDQQAVQAAEQGRWYSTKDYDAKTVELELRQIIKKKDLRSLESSYSRRILIIYSDEPYIYHDEVLTHLPTITVGSLTNFSDVHFMIPPAVNISGSPTVDEFCQVVHLRTG